MSIATLNRRESQPAAAASCWVGDIDLDAEPAITLRKAAKDPLFKRDGKSPHVSAIYRWASPTGCRGVRLETVMIGGSTCTTLAAMRRFVARCSNPPQPEPVVTPDQRRKQIGAAQQRLAAAGI